MQERKVARIVRKAAGGDARAFAVLYDMFVGRVYPFVRMRVRDDRDAEELTETVFLKAYRSLPTFEDRGLPFSAWLFRIARNEVIDHVRRSARQLQVVEEPEEEPVSPICVEDETMARLDALRLREAVDMLNADQAEVVIARFFWGLSVTQTAMAVGRTEGAVKAMQHRAVRTLGRLLAEDRPQMETGFDERAM